MAVELHSRLEEAAAPVAGVDECNGDISPTVRNQSSVRMEWRDLRFVENAALDRFTGQRPMILLAARQTVRVIPSLAAQG